jgi:hypothetical protein
MCSNDPGPIAEWKEEQISPLAALGRNDSLSVLRSVEMRTGVVLICWHLWWFFGNVVWQPMRSELGP